ncbi:hypothetical protein Tco_0031581 [Tanacetum coccineum]
MDKNHYNRLSKGEQAVDQIVTDAVDWAIQAPFRDRFRDLPEADMKKILHHRMWESNSYQAHEDHKMLYEALEKSMACDHTDQLLTDLAEARRKKKKRHASPKTPPGSLPHQPPPPPPPAGSSGTPGASGASGLSQLPFSFSTPPSNLRDHSPYRHQLHMDDDTTHDEQLQSSGDEDINHDHIPTVNLRHLLLLHYAHSAIETSLLGRLDMAIFYGLVLFLQKARILHLNQREQDMEGPAYEIVKVFHQNVINLQ